MKNKIKELMTELRDFKFQITLIIEFTKIQSDGVTKFNTVFPNSKAETIINESDIDDAFKSFYTTITSST